MLYAVFNLEDTRDEMMIVSAKSLDEAHPLGQMFFMRSSKRPDLMIQRVTNPGNGELRKHVIGGWGKWIDWWGGTPGIDNFIYYVVRHIKTSSLKEIKEREDL